MANFRSPIFGHVTGQGPGVLFVHGWNHSRRIWRDVISNIHSEATSVAVDLPGFGDSPRLPAQEITIPNMSSLVAEIIAITRTILSDRNIPLHTIVADSLGAIYILELLSIGYDHGDLRGDIHLEFLGDSKVGSSNRRHSGQGPCKELFEGVSSILLSGCPSDGLPIYTSPVKNLEIVWAGLSALNKLPKWASKKVLRVLSLGTVHRYSDISDDLIESVLQADPVTSQILFKEMANYSTGNNYFKNRDPSLNIKIVRGEKDRIVSRSTSSMLARRIDAEYEEIRRVGHTPMIECPRRYARIIKSTILD